MNTCYTVITDGYDTLKDPYVTEGWEYIVFSDVRIEHPIWECTVTGKHNREVKIKANTLLHRNLTLYVDGSMQIIGDLNEFCEEVPNWFTIHQHPYRDNIFQEAEAVIKLNKMNRGLVMSQMNRYLKHGYEVNGLAECNIMLRDLSDQRVRDICNDWWEEWLTSCGRDQLSLPYVFWSHNQNMDLFGEDIFRKYFILNRHK